MTSASTISDFVEYSRDTFQTCEDADLHMCDVRNSFMAKMDIYLATRKTDNPYMTDFNKFPLVEWVQYRTTQDELKTLERKHEKICNFQTAHVGVRKISAKKWKSPTPAECGICMESHSYRDSIVTSCRHHFGKECFYRLIHSNMQKDVLPPCPFCRSTNYSMFRYKRLPVV